MRNGEPGMFIGLSTMRNGHVQLQWSRIQMFVTFNAIALPVAFGTNQPAPVQLLISLVGFVMHIGLYLAGRRTIGWLEYWNEKLAALEELDQEGESTEGARVAVFSQHDFEGVRGGWLATNAYLWVFGAGMAFWLCYAEYVYTHPN